MSRAEVCPATIGLLFQQRADRSLLAAFLGELGHPVLAADPAADNALASVERASLLIVDESAARRHADSLMQAKARARPLTLPILVMVSTGSNGSAWLQRGFDDLLRMPVVKQEMLARIETFLRLRQQSEEILRASEAFSRSSLDAIAANICVVDGEGRITLTNRAWRDFAAAGTGTSAATLEGASYLAACRAEQAGNHDVSALIDVLEGRSESCTFEYPCHAPDVHRWFVATATRFINAGAPFTVVAHTDVTARKESELASQHSEARFRSLVTLSSDFYWETDAEHRLSERSTSGARAALSAFGPTLGARRWELSGVDVEADWAAHRSALDAREPFRDFEYSRLAPDGRLFYFSISGEPVHDNDGRFLGYRGVGSDISERKREARLLAMEHGATRCLSEAASPADALRGLIRVICATKGWECGRYWTLSEPQGVLKAVEGWGVAEPAIQAFLAITDHSLPADKGLMGEALNSLAPAWSENLTADPRAIRKDVVRSAGLRGVCSVPVVAGARKLGVLNFAGRAVRAPDERLREALMAIGAQLGQFLLRREAEAVLRHSEGRFRDLTELSSDFYFEQDEGWRTTFVSAGFEEHTGVSAAEVLGRTPWQTSFRPGSNWAEYERELRAGKPFRNLEYRCTDARGVQRRFLVSGRPITDSQGGFRGYRGVGTNITQRWLNEQNLQRFRAALDASDDAIYVVDLTTMQLIDANDAVARRSGYSRDELIGRSPSILFEDVSHADLRQAYQALAQGRKEFGLLRAVHVSKDGRRIPVEITRRVFETPTGRLLVGVARDITMRIEQERALHESTERLRRSAARQQVVAAFGRFALKRRTKDELIAEAMRILGEEADAIAMLERLPDGSFRAAHIVGLEVAPGRVIPPSPDSPLQRAMDRLTPMRADEEHLASRPEWIRDMQSAVYVPVTENGHAFGVLAIYSRTGRAFDDEFIKFAQPVGHALSAALQREYAERAARTHARRQQLIAQFGQKALADSDLDALFVAGARAGIDGAIEAAAIFERDSTGTYILRAAAGIESSAYIGRPLEVCPGCPVRTAVGGERPTVMADHDQHRCTRVHGRWGAGMRCSINVSIDSEGGAFGVLALLAREPNALREDDQQFAQSLANVLSAAVRRSQGEKKLMRMAQFDSLTDLPNRNLLEDRLRHTMAQATRKQWHVAFLFVDLDRFKLVNDTYGHPLGDNVLREVAERLRGCVRADDTVGRISGDEFGIVLADLARAEDAALVGQKILDALATPFGAEDKELFVGASIGISIFPSDTQNADVLLRNADMAMYRAKETGRNRIEYFTPAMNERTVAKLQLGSDLRRAIDRREFALHYQPKVELETGALVGMEALLRWQHPQRGLISPAEFIPALEESGLILPVGDWVVEEACAQIRRWQLAGLHPVPVAVNISARQFRRQHLDLLVQETLAARDVSAQLLELEITESSIAEDPAEAVRILARLRDAGIKISIDDFGTGYSSLSALTRLPLSALKIDRSFVRHAAERVHSAAIVRAIIDMAHTLGFIVVAEGVETEQQAKFLWLHKCDQGQGYLYAKPEPAELAGKRLARS